MASRPDPVPEVRCHAVVPAAGVGSRMGSAQPKQYLSIAGQSVLAWSVRALLAAPFIESVVVVVAPGDPRAQALLGALARVQVLPVGGASRRDSVLAGIQSAGSAWADDDFVLVHDAARPGLSLAALTRLHQALLHDPVGGLLAMPASDTVKQASSEARVAATVPRESLWLAQTPQMFRHHVLREALSAHPHVTDEAAAIEASGLRPRLVEGERGNFKITTPGDLALMSAWLASVPVAGSSD